MFLTVLVVKKMEKYFRNTIKMRKIAIQFELPTAAFGSQRSEVRIFSPRREKAGRTLFCRLFVLP